MNDGIKSIRLNHHLGVGRSVVAGCYVDCPQPLHGIATFNRAGHEIHGVCGRINDRRTDNSNVPGKVSVCSAEATNTNFGMVGGTATVIKVARPKCSAAPVSVEGVHGVVH